jgi:hypothetical protein
VNCNSLRIKLHKHCTQLLLLHENDRRNERADSEDRAPCTMDEMVHSMDRAMAAFTWPRLGAPVLRAGVAMALLHAPWLAAIAVEQANFGSGNQLAAKEEQEKWKIECEKEVEMAMKSVRVIKIAAGMGMEYRHDGLYCN